MFILSLLVLTTTTLACPYHKPPQIMSILPHHLLLQSGPVHRIVLECKADAEPLPSYQWFKDYLPLSVDSPVPGIQVVSSAGGSKLEMNSPGPEHAGYYHCQAENIHGKAVSDMVHVTDKLVRSVRGAVAPIWTVAPETEVATVGSRVVLRCEAVGVPEPAVEWLKNGEVIEGETDNRLVVDDISESDVGNYACNASNIAGYEYKNVIINLLTVSAKITRGPKTDQMVSKGSVVTLHCETEGYPRPRVLWKMNGTEIKDSDKYKVNVKTGALSIMNVDMTDEGSYECLAKNHGEDQAKGNLIVKINITIMDGPKDQQAVIFSSILMNCSVVADMTQNLTVMWKKNNIDLGRVGFPRSDRIDTDENYALRIKNATFGDSGTYTCIAETPTSHTTASGQLTIQGIQPLLAQPLWPADQLAGSVITLACTILQGYPAPHIVWYKDGQNITMDTSTTTGQDHSLHIAGAQQHHSGDYTCRAHNREGSDSLHIPLRVRRKSRIVSPKASYEFVEGQEVIFNCEADVDEGLVDTLEIHWFKGEERLNLSSYQSHQTSLDESLLPKTNHTEATFALLENSSLIISAVQPSDLGYYNCEVQTSLEPGLRSDQSEIYWPVADRAPWWIILVVILAITVLLFGICLTCHRTGYYGVDHVKKNGKMHNVSDIFYTTGEKDSIMREMDSLPSSYTSPPISRSSIFTPITVKQLPSIRLSTSAMSAGSLFSSEDLITRGLGEIKTLEGSIEHEESEGEG